jgi:hypothetical protein
MIEAPGQMVDYLNTIDRSANLVHAGHLTCDHLYLLAKKCPCAALVARQYAHLFTTPEQLGGKCGPQKTGGTGHQYTHAISSPPNSPGRLLLPAHRLRNRADNAGRSGH